MQYVPQCPQCNGKVLLAPMQVPIRAITIESLDRDMVCLDSLPVFCSDCNWLGVLSNVDYHGV